MVCFVQERDKNLRACSVGRFTKRRERNGNTIRLSRLVQLTVSLLCTENGTMKAEDPKGSAYLINTLLCGNIYIRNLRLLWIRTWLAIWRISNTFALLETTNQSRFVFLTQVQPQVRVLFWKRNRGIGVIHGYPSNKCHWLGFRNFVRSIAVINYIDSYISLYRLDNKYASTIIIIIITYSAKTIKKYRRYRKLNIACSVLACWRLLFASGLSWHNYK